MPGLFDQEMDLQLFGDGDPSKTGGFSAEYVQELRNEAAGWRTKLRETEGELQKANGQLADANKKIEAADARFNAFVSKIRGVLKVDENVKPEDLPGKIQEATAKSTVTVEKAQEALRKSVFMASAIKQGIRKDALEDAYKLADWSNVKVDLESTSVFLVDKDGKQIEKDGKPVSGLDSLVENLVKEKPYLVGGNKPTAIGSPSSPSGEPSKGDPESIGASLAKQMKDVGGKIAKAREDYFPQQ